MTLSTASPSGPPPVLARPRSKTEFFITCTAIALQGFGGVLAIVQREMVDKRGWLTRQQFVEEWAVAQILPGPNVVNLVIMLGDRYFGVRGALAGLAGILAVPLGIAIGLMLFYNHFADNPLMQGALRGMGAASAGLIGAAALKMTKGLKGNVIGVPVTIALITSTFVAVGLLRIPLIWVVLGLGIPSCTYAWLLLRRTQTGAKPGATP